MEVEIDSPDYHHSYEEESPDTLQRQHQQHAQQQFPHEPGSASSYEYNSSMSNSMPSSLEPSPERSVSAGWVDEGEGALSFKINSGRSSKRKVRASERSDDDV